MRNHIDIEVDAQCPGCDASTGVVLSAAAILSSAEDSSRLRVVNPIPSSPACLACHSAANSGRGYVAVDFDMTQAQRAAAKRWRITLALGLGATALLVLLIGFLLRSLIAQPVGALVDAMDRIAAGDLGARAAGPRRNELGLLAAHFNRMAQQLQAAHTESTLLYTLVVETSKKLETGEFATSVSQVIQQNLRPSHSAFVLDTVGDGWACAASGAQRPCSLTTGDGSLQAALLANSGEVNWLSEEPVATLIDQALRTQRLHQTMRATGLTFALPVVTEARLIGLLACIEIPAGIPVAAELLRNLGVHLTLAAINSRHYTGAITDGLTRLHRKQYGLVRLEEAVLSARRYNSGLLLIMCDIDHFKSINDNYGHIAGDRVLREVGRRIRENVRRADVAVRYGGEEFMLILPRYNIDADAPAVVAEKIRRAIAAAPIEIGDGHQAIGVTISAGVAAYTANQSETGQTLIARADAALYCAKHNGRNRVEVDY